MFICQKSPPKKRWMNHIPNINLKFHSPFLRHFFWRIRFQLSSHNHKNPSLECGPVANPGQSRCASPPTTFSRSPGLGCVVCKKGRWLCIKVRLCVLLMFFWGLIVEFEATCRFLLRLKRQKLTKYMKENDICVGLVCFPYLEIKSSF